MLKQKLAVAAGIVGLGALMALPSMAAPKPKRLQWQTMVVSNATCATPRLRR